MTKDVVWRKLDGGMTQQAVGDELGMGRTDVANLSGLRKIVPEAWRVVTDTVRAVTANSGGAVTASVTDVTFSENLLRSILPLTADQQLDLVKRLADGVLSRPPVPRIPAATSPGRQALRSQASA